MRKKLNILAVIPARARSKGIRNKNIKILNKKPLLAWSILEAKKISYIDCIHVSTDSIKIAKIAKNYGADTSFLRPKNLASDNAQVIDTLLYAIEKFGKEGKKFDIIISLPPTSPLRTYIDIKKAFALLCKKKAQAVVSVCETDYHPNWCNTLNKNLSMHHFLKPKIEHKNRQELKKFYRLNGAIYLAYCEFLLKKKSFYGKKTYAYIMPKEKSIDINVEFDFKIAELILTRKKVGCDCFKKT